MVASRRLDHRAIHWYSMAGNKLLVVGWVIKVQDSKLGAATHAPVDVGLSNPSLQLLRGRLPARAPFYQGLFRTRLEGDRS
jgi:hypothetical protein